MNTSEESGEWTNPDGQNDRSMDDEEEEETEEGESTLQEKQNLNCSMFARGPQRKRKHNNVYDLFCVFV